jgi:hypothetical protein
MTAPLDKIEKKLKEASFIKKGKSHPKFLWLPLSHQQILILYNFVFRRFLNYYSFVHNYSTMSRKINWFLKTSCAKLLAAKFNIRTRAKVYKKFTIDLNCKNDKDEIIAKFIRPDYTTKNMKFLKSSTIIKSLFALHCSLATT